LYDLLLCKANADEETPVFSGFVGFGFHENSDNFVRRDIAGLKSRAKQKRATLRVKGEDDPLVSIP
jgi:hypothetical protein